MTDRQALSATAKKAGSFSAIIGLISGVVGIAVGALGALWIAKAEWDAWQQIKGAHSAPRSNTAIVYDHSSLSDSDIEAIGLRLGLDEFVTRGDIELMTQEQSQAVFDRIANVERLYAKKSELPDPKDVILSGSRVSVQGVSKYLYDEDSKGRDELDVTMGGAPMYWTLRKQ